MSDVVQLRLYLELLLDGLTALREVHRLEDEVRRLTEELYEKERGDL